MYAGIAKIDITPQGPVWMEGMPRAHPSTGVHDSLFARALVLANEAKTAAAFAVVSLDVCAVTEALSDQVAQAVARRTGIPAEHVALVATHTHSGPAVVGMYNPAATDYLPFLVRRLIEVIEQAATKLRPVTIGFGTGRESTISHYRRLLADDGRVVMNWEPFPAERIVGPLGEIDPAVDVLRIAPARQPRKTLCLMFSHAGHPNVLSGDNYLLSADYPGVAQALLDKACGGMSMFLTAALGTMDIDGLRDRDWPGAERIGGALADAVSAAARTAIPAPKARIRGAVTQYDLPRRRITAAELAWAREVLARVGDTVQALPDGVGDDYLARLYTELNAQAAVPVPVRQLCFAVGDAAFITFPGEIYTEIGMRLKAASPFRHTVILGVANGYVRYIPTRVAVQQGGYAEVTRIVDASAEDLVFANSLKLLEQVRRLEPRQRPTARKSAA